MKAASIHELKKELNLKTQAEISDLTLRLARFKKENKELLTYLLFEAENEKGYVETVKSEMREKFEEIPTNHNLYFKLKMIRKILRMTNKYIKYSAEDTTEVELRIYFCQSVKGMKIPFSRSLALENLYTNCLSKTVKLVGKMHEDLQQDYNEDLMALNKTLH